MVIKPGRAPNRSVDRIWEQARRILTRSGITANVYTAGAGDIAVNGLPTRNYTLSDGSTGFAAVDGPAGGLVLDGMGSVGAELVTNGDGTSAVGWLDATGVASVSGGELVNTGLVAPYPEILQDFATVIGQTYLFSVTLRRGTSANGAWAIIKRDSGGAQLGSTAVVTSTSPTQAQFFFVALDASTRISLVQNAATGDTGTVLFDNISVKQVIGIHVMQPTTANKPTERRGLYNLGLSSANVGNATYWTPNQVNAIAANLVTPNASATVHSVTQTITTLAQTYTVAFELKPNGYTKFGFRENTATGAYAAVNCVGAGSVLVSSSVTASIVALASDSYLVALTFAAAAVASQLGAYVLDAAYTTTSPHAYTYSGDNTSGMYINGFGLFTGTLTAQQILDSGGIPLTTSAAASNPSAGRYSWGFDGGDSLKTDAPAWNYSDDHVTIVAGSCAGPANNNWMAAPATSSVSDVKRIGAVSYDGSLGAIQASWYDGTTYVHPEYFYAKSTPFVATAAQRSSVGYLRVNGVQRGAESTAAVTLFTPTKGAIGNDYAAAGGQALNGNISIVIAIKGTLSDADMLVLERFAASTLPNFTATF